MRGLWEEGTFGVHPRIDKKERMVGSPAAVGSLCGVLGWGGVRQKPFLELGGHISGFPYHMGF